MESERRNKFRVAGLLLVLVGVVVIWAWRSQSSVPLPSSNGASAQTAGVRKPKSITPGAPDVHLKALGAGRAKPMEGARNLFRFKPKPVPPSPSVGPAVAAKPPPPAPIGPPAPPTSAPIALKFIGLVQNADKTQRLAVLSDGRGSIPIYGKEGDIIEGRYRIVHIGVESIELAYLDGRGRQTIRLSGG